jgi:hypothetical protein
MGSNLFPALRMDNAAPNRSPESAEEAERATGGGFKSSDWRA